MIIRCDKSSANVWGLGLVLFDSDLIQGEGFCGLTLRASRSTTTEGCSQSNASRSSDFGLGPVLI